MCDEGDEEVPETRRNLIFDIIEQKGEITIIELCEMFPEVSSMTIRRDLDVLEHENKIVKIKGGAKSINHLSRAVKMESVEDDYVRREMSNPMAKALIAKKAVPLLEEGRSVFIDAGSTMMSLVAHLGEGRYYIFTSGVNVALSASANKHAKVNIMGGNLNKSNLCISGASAINQIKDINIDIAFVGASGFSHEDGFTNGDFNECELKRAVIKKAKKTIILMDSSKFGKNLPYTFAHPEDIDVLVLDKSPDETLKEIAKQANMQII